MKSVLVWIPLLWVVLTLNSKAALHYVDLNSPQPTPPYLDWSTAARSLQDAVDVALADETVLVTNGVYNTGGRQLGPWDVTNRVAVTNRVLVQSVNGPAVTLIQGYQVPGMAAATNAIRCALLGSNAVLSGFTLTNGAAGTGNYINGGGVAGDFSSTCVITNCVLTGNLCAGAGGGADRGTFINCIFTGNRASSGGAASGARLLNCIATNNFAAFGGGAIYGCKATNCLLACNFGTNYGGGSAYSTLVNCTVARNAQFLSQGGGGSYHDTLFNCIIYYNSGQPGSNYTGSGLYHCCATPQATGGPANLTNAPGFVDLSGGNFRLAPDSPCINAGNNHYVQASTDLAGNTRVAGATVDAGAYEFPSPASAISYAWLQQYGLPLDGSADAADPDNDGMNTWQEWRCGTDPTDPLSVLRMLPPVTTSTGLLLSWQSVSGVTYSLQRSTDLATQPGFGPMLSNLVGQATLTSVLDTNATGHGPYYYRVGVQP